MQNQLFNLVELIYSDEERSSMMNRILTAAQSLVTGDDKLLGLNDNKVSVWGFLHKYFFNIQYYFPKIAYLEQARIRYEFAELMGHLGARSVRPISQSIGSQVENEQQFMEQRVVYMASFAVFGALGNKSGAIGIADSADEFAFQGSELPDGTPADFVFDVTPHQYIYPCGFDGQTTRPTYQRTSPKQTCKVTVAKGVVGNSDTSMGIRGVNYYSDLGDFDDKSIDSNLTVNGKRLIMFNDAWSKNIFRPTSINVKANNLRKFHIRTNNAISSIDLSNLVRCSTISTGIRNVIYPKSSLLKSIYILDFVETFELKEVPNLELLDASSQRVLYIREINIGSNVGTNVEGFTVQPIVETIYSAQKSSTSPSLQSIHIENVKWTDFDVEALSWFADIPTCEFKGTISIKETDEYRPAVAWDMKNKFIKKFGDIDTGNGNLTLEYRKRNFEASTAKIKGNFFVDDYIVRDKGYNDVETFDFSVTPESNYMNTQTKIQFSLEGGNTSAYSMSADGKLSVNVYQLSDKQNFATIKAAVTQYENGSFVTENVTKKIEIWNRPAQVGDVVYYDGSYRELDMDDGEKTPIGLCFYVAPRYPNDSNDYKKGNIVEDFFDSNDIQQRLVVRKDVVNGRDSYRWGAIARDSFDEMIDLFTINAEGGKEVLKLNGVQIGDIVGIESYNNSGLGANGDERKVTEENFVAYDDYTILNKGFLPFPTTTQAGNGFAYQETASEKNSRTIDAMLTGWSSEISDYYKKFKGRLVNAGYAQTLKIIHFRNKLISDENNGESNIDNFKDEQNNKINIHLFKPQKTELLTEMDSLFENIEKIKTYFRDVYMDSNIDKWQTLLYPGASVAYAFEPKVSKSEILSEKFKAHNWFLPTSGLAFRLYWLINKDTNFNKAIGRGFFNIADKTEWALTSSEMYNGFDFVRIKFDTGEINSQLKYYDNTVYPICAF
jgi:hypothetical protein